MARMTKAQREWRPGMPQKRRSIKVLFGSTVLLLEAFAVLFGTLVSFGLHRDDYPVGILLGGGAVLGVALIGTCAFLSRPAGVMTGWILQVVIIATGLVEPMMFVVGILFGIAWWYSMTTGARLDRENAERDRAEKQWAAEHPGDLPGEPTG